MWWSSAANLARMASTQPLAKKLLIKPGNTIAPINAPKNYKALLGELPDGAKSHPRWGESWILLRTSSPSGLRPQ